MKRSGFAPRTAPMSRQAIVSEPKPPKGPRKRLCQACKSPFLPFRALEAWCSPACGLIVAEKRVMKQRAKQQRAEHAADKAKLESMKSINKLKAELQTVFNLYIRLRDAGKPCICCGKFATAAALAKPGGAYDACHFRSRGSADHLRYNEDNVHLGLKDCNTWGHKDYRGGLIERIGLDRVEALESNHDLVKWTKDGLREMKAHYQQRVKELKKELRNVCPPV